jgi:spermidine/putrescine-binding protein
MQEESQVLLRQQGSVAERDARRRGGRRDDVGHRRLDAQSRKPDIQFIVPRSGALGWLDTFALPARGRNDAAAYAWINFTMRPEIAAKITKSVGNFSAAVNTDAFIDRGSKRSSRGISR